MTSNRSFVRRVVRAFGTLGSAARVANATENGWRPAASDLVRLGIKPATFGAIVEG